MSAIPAPTGPRFPWVTILSILLFAGWWAGTHDVHAVRASVSSGLQSPVNTDRLRAAFQSSEEARPAPIEALAELPMEVTAPPVDIATGGDGGAAGQ